MKHRILDPADLKVETFETEAVKVYDITIIVAPDTDPDDTWQCGCCRNAV